MNDTDTQKVSFWRKRLKEAIKAGDELEAISVTLDWNGVDKAHKKIIEELISQEDSVLDVGCGIGRTAGWFKNYVGVDFVSEFLEIAERDNPKKRFILADLKDGVPFEDKSFDWVVAISLSNYEQFLDELKRVGKKVLILCYGEPENYEVFE